MSETRFPIDPDYAEKAEIDRLRAWRDNKMSEEIGYYLPRDWETMTYQEIIDFAANQCGDTHLFLDAAKVTEFLLKCRISDLERNREALERTRDSLEAELKAKPDWNGECMQLHKKVRELEAEVKQLKESKPRWIPCTERFPEIGQEILLRFPLGDKWSWCAGTVDGSDDGLFVDFDLDGQEINTRCFWMEITFDDYLKAGEAK